MGVFERKWVLALAVLILVIGFNGLSGWMASRSEKQLKPLEPVQSTSEAAVDSALPASEAKADSVTVHICGAVSSPGVFALPAGSRVNDVLEKAGGFTSKADSISVNLAEVLTDGQQIVIYELSTEPQVKGVSGGSRSKSPVAAASGLPVSINHGSMEALMLLDGIGEKTAQKIMDYRKVQGGFKSIEEIKNVPGIGDKKFEQIKNDIRL